MRMSEATYTIKEMKLYNDFKFLYLRGADKDNSPSMMLRIIDSLGMLGYHTLALIAEREHQQEVRMNL
jgi:hypothetical protein